MSVHLNTKLIIEDIFRYLQLNLSSLCKSALREMQATAKSAPQASKQIPREWADNVASHIAFEQAFIRHANRMAYHAMVGIMPDVLERDMHLKWQALTVNYGLGEDMADDSSAFGKGNPNLTNGYMSNPTFYDYQARKGSKKVYTRPKAARVYRPKDKTFTPSTATTYRYKGRSPVAPPSYWFENAVLKYLNNAKIADAVLRAIDQVPIGAAKYWKIEAD